MTFKKILFVIWSLSAIITSGINAGEIPLERPFMSRFHEAEMFVEIQQYSNRGWTIPLIQYHIAMRFGKQYTLTDLASILENLRQIGKPLELVKALMSPAKKKRKNRTRNTQPTIYQVQPNPFPPISHFLPTASPAQIEMRITSDTDQTGDAFGFPDWAAAIDSIESQPDPL
ncbi:MAG: hypothetical protein LBJ77_01810 [Holosporales bacterium]|jgi:hypothetical protein|nr:hypothetical protein [Holosporales bacterium]